MAKKKPTNPEDAGAETQAAPEAPKVAKPKTRVQFTFVKGIDEGEKLAPQAKVIVETIQSLGTAPREQVVEALSDGRLKTRQPPERILTYYQKALASKGYFTMEKIAEAA